MGLFDFASANFETGQIPRSMAITGGTALCKPEAAQDVKSQHGKLKHAPHAEMLWHLEACMSK